jgi:hypothetical protein
MRVGVQGGPIRILAFFFFPRTPLRRAAATDARDAPFSLVSSLQWARLPERLKRRVTFKCLSNRSFRLVSLV